ncbi:MAG TPA: NrtA/SsuA/CpmA family ABC transporter substrate-binding protein [Burkholderiales bacterium]|jgi:ABC-type nitrate/sulfonate/bicarbonate transport system substrate-binding protein|nr:NrtA/SsuA/CpmA family ABC transporter substrate-binding protein [Burkholderiales bacterium]
MTSAFGNARRRLGAALLALAASTLVSGAAQAQAPRKINVGMQPIVNGPIYIAIKEKYFEKLGLEVNLVKFTSGPAQFAALAGGQVDLAWGGMGAFSLAKANGQDLHFISIFMDYNPLEALVVPGNSPAKTIKDLVGRKIALVQGSDAHYGTLRTLAKHGVDPKSVSIVGMAPPQQIAALEKGDVDAMFSWEPFLTPILDKGGRLLARNSELDPGPAFLSWAGKRAWLEANGDVVVKILKGWNMGLAKMKADPDLAIRLTLEFTGMGEPQARAIMKGLGHFDATAALDPKSSVYWAKGSKLARVLQDFQAFGKEAGLIKDAINVDDFVMTKYMQAVKDGK